VNDLDAAVVSLQFSSHPGYARSEYVVKTLRNRSCRCIQKGDLVHFPARIAVDESAASPDPVKQFVLNKTVENFVGGRDGDGKTLRRFPGRGITCPVPELGMLQFPPEYLGSAFYLAGFFPESK
jgi:hypothetical protein